MRLLVMASIVGLTACGLSWPAPVPPITVTREAPAGTFSPHTTFELTASFEDWATHDAERQAKYKSSFEHGIGKAENRGHRQWFITNPRLANKTDPPAFTLRVTAHELDMRTPFAKTSATVQVMRGADIVEQIEVNASVSKGSDPEGQVATELGEVIGDYIVCRSATPPKKCH